MAALEHCAPRTPSSTPLSWRPVGPRPATAGVPSTSLLLLLPYRRDMRHAHVILITVTPPRYLRAVSPAAAQSLAFHSLPQGAALTSCRRLYPRGRTRVDRRRPFLHGGRNIFFPNFNTIQAAVLRPAKRPTSTASSRGRR